MIKLLLIAALLAGPTLAEQTGTARPALAQPPAMEGCDHSDLKRLIGQPADERRAREASGATVVRMFRTGEPVTDDIRSDRLNLELDAAGKVVRAGCG